MDLVEVPDGDKLEEEVCLDSEEEAERAEEEGFFSRPLMKLEGVGIVCPYPRLNLDPSWGKWELPIVKRHTEG